MPEFDFEIAPYNPPDAPVTRSVSAEEATEASFAPGMAVAQGVGDLGAMAYDMANEHMERRKAFQDTTDLINGQIAIDGIFAEASASVARMSLEGNEPFDRRARRIYEDASKRASKLIGSQTPSGVPIARSREVQERLGLYVRERQSRAAISATSEFISRSEEESWIRLQRGIDAAIDSADPKAEERVVSMINAAKQAGGHGANLAELEVLRDEALKAIPARRLDLRLRDSLERTLQDPGVVDDELKMLRDLRAEVRKGPKGAFPTMSRDQRDAALTDIDRVEQAMTVSPEEQLKREKLQEDIRVREMDDEFYTLFKVKALDQARILQHSVNGQQYDRWTARLATQKKIAEQEASGSGPEKGTQIDAVIEAEQLFRTWGGKRPEGKGIVDRAYVEQWVDDNAERLGEANYEQFLARARSYEKGEAQEQSGARAAVDDQFWTQLRALRDTIDSEGAGLQTYVARSGARQEDVEKQPRDLTEEVLEETRPSLFFSDEFDRVVLDDYYFEHLIFAYREFQNAAGREVSQAEREQFVAEILRPPSIAVARMPMDKRYKQVIANMLNGGSGGAQ